MHVLPKRTSGVLVAAGILLSACSVLYDLSPDQCGTKADCASFGSKYTCEEGICKAPAGTDECRTSADCADLGADYSCNDGNCEAPASGGRGGTSSGGTGGNAGASGGTVSRGGAGSGGTSIGEGGEPGTAGNDSEAGSGNTGGEPPDTECTTTKQCLTLHGLGNPSACVQGSCVELRSDECPVLQPALDELFLDNLAGQDPIILGAYASLGNSLVSNSSRNYDLAVTEVTHEYGGVPGPNSTTRPVVFLVCRNNYADRDELDRSLDHLTTDLKVPALISALPADDLQHAFQRSQASAEAGEAPNVFFMSPIEWSNSLANIDDQNLMWHLLPGGKYVALPYAPLLSRAIAYMRAHGGVSPADDIKVALVTANERFLTDMSDTVYDSIEFNGKSAAENLADGNLLPLSVTSFGNDPNKPLTEQIEALLEFRPHIILGLTANELFSKIVPAIESGWTTNAPTPVPPLPFYLLSPHNYNNGQLQSVLNNYVGIERRMAGVNVPSAPPPQRELRDYEVAFKSAYPEKEARLGYENFYDAAYYLLYSIVGAGRIGNLTGNDLSKGMTDLLSGPAFGVGHKDIVDAFTSLSPVRGKITLNGTLGPPSFDAEGARSDPGSVWCVRLDDLGVAEQLTDVLRYDPDTQELVDPSPSDGALPCNPDF